MNTITIFNLSDRPRTFDLPHQEVCVKIGRCLCHRNGAPRSVLFRAKRVAHKGIPEYVLLAKRIRAAVDAGELRVFEDHAVPAEPSRTAGTAKNTSTKPRKKKTRRSALKE